MDDVAVIKPARVKIGGLWKSKTKNGKQYLSGSIGYDAMIEIWPNTKREGMEGAKDPDYQIFIVPRFKKPTSEHTDEPKDQISEVPF
jgi:hypothetical protein